MKKEEKGSKEDNRYFISVVERILRRDPLLLPYFEDGVFKLVDNPDDEFMSFKPGIAPEVQAFIKERVEAVLGENPGNGDQDAIWLWQEREKVKKQLEVDQILLPYFITEDLVIKNSVDGFKIEIADRLPDEDAARLNKRIREVLVMNFGLIPERGKPTKSDPEFDVAS